MCGIYAHLHPTNQPPPPLDPLLLSLLRARGPNACRQGSVELGNGFTLTYCSTVLWLQGAKPQAQPVIDNAGNILMWNGDVYNREVLGDENNNDSDTTLLAERLCETSSEESLLGVLGKVKGPWACVYYHKATNKLWFGRDCFGRSSLLMKMLDTGFVLASVSPSTQLGFCEVLAKGVFQLRLPSQQLLLHRWKNLPKIEAELFDVGHSVSCPLLTMESFSALWKPVDELETEGEIFGHLLKRPHVRGAVEKLLQLLRSSIERRVVRHQPSLCKDCVESMTIDSCSHPSVSVLLSGGVDSTLLALLVAQALPEQTIPLVNVAFQQELNQLLPGRGFELTCVNVSKEELAQQRIERIQHLLHPLDTVLDDSIGCAIWFASREAAHRARVVVMGMGIDEQLGGYSRHRAAFTKGGSEMLAAEIKMDIGRISERNLGRDDRIVSDHGISARYPFLDEDFVNYLTGLELSLKCDFRLGRGLGEKLVLRLAAHSLGLKGAAKQQKRAVQFGSKIAKMENKKEKAHQKAVR